MEEPKQEILSHHPLLIASPDLDRLHEGVEENSDTNRPTQELDKSGCSEESEEADLDYSSGVYDTTSHSDEVKGIPGVFEIRLERGGLIRI